MESRIFEEKVKDAFSNAKKDINNIKNDLNALKEEFMRFKRIKEEIFTMIEEIRQKKEEKMSEVPPLVSFANKQTNKQTNEQTLNKHITTFQEVDDVFKKLTKREFLIFLTVYQLEEDKGRPITYEELGSYISLSPNGIRFYIHSLLSKNAPLQKIKHNKLVILTIPQNFRELQLKTKLTSMYMQIDSQQTKLSDL